MPSNVELDITDADGFAYRPVANPCRSNPGPNPPRNNSPRNIALKQQADVTHVRNSLCFGLALQRIQQILR